MSQTSFAVGNGWYVDGTPGGPKKLLFYHHLLHLPKNSLAYEIADTQASLAYPGLVQECYELIEKYKLPDAKDQTKIQWKKLVKNKIQKENENDLLENVKNNYKKLDVNTMSEEKCEIKPYMKD